MAEDKKDDIILSIRGMCKSFGRNQVLDHINMDVKRGTIMGLMGENGAGKSTMMKCLFGTYQKDEGTIILDGKEVSFSGPKDALENGIAMVHQELNQCLERSVVDNLFLGRYPVNSAGVVDEARMKKEAADLFRKLDITVSLTAPMRTMSVSKRQMCEIAKAISYNSKIIVLDEPTSSLTVPEVEKLFTMMRRLRDQGISLIYISHKMDEIFEICDEVSVLRDGSLVMTKSTKDTNMNELIAAMVGRSLDNRFPPVDNTPGESILEIKHLSTKYEPHLQDITFDVKKGEIFGLYGLVGAGRTELRQTHELREPQAGHGTRLCDDHRGEKGERPVPEGRSDLQHDDLKPLPLQKRPCPLRSQDDKGDLEGDPHHAHQVHGPGGQYCLPLRRQPAEGHLRQVAGAGSQGLPDG